MNKGVSEFLRHLSNVGRDSKTVICYKSDLNQFCHYFKEELDQNNGSWNFLTHSRVLDYITYLERHNFAPATVTRKVSSLRSYLSYLVSMGLAAESVLITKVKQRESKLQTSVV